MAHARRKGIQITTAGVALADDVADVAIGLVLVLARRILEADRFVRRGDWENGAFPNGRSLSGKRLGIVGLGNIGNAVARKAEAFSMEVAYCGPKQKPTIGYRYIARCEDLADWSDYLVLTCPGGEGTRHIINADVLRALGPTGYLVNVARGSVVDERALLRALDRGDIAGAGLDVFAEEPFVPPELRGSEKVVVLPHIGSGAEECSRRQAEAMIGALQSRLLGSVT